MNFLENYRANSRSQFSNAGGSGYNNYGGYGDVFSRADGPAAPGGFELMDPNASVIQIQIVNASTTTTTATVFGSVYDLTDANKPAQLTYTVSGAFTNTNLQLKTQGLYTTFRILGLLYETTTAGQITNNWTVYDQAPIGGANQSLPIYPNRWKTPLNNISTLVQAPDFQLLVKPTNYIQFKMNASETVTLTFTMFQESNPGYKLQPGAAAQKVNALPAPSGLPMQDYAVANKMAARALGRPIWA